MLLMSNWSNKMSLDWLISDSWLFYFIDYFIIFLIDFLFISVYWLIDYFRSPGDFETPRERQDYGEIGGNNL